MVDIVVFLVDAGNSGDMYEYVVLNVLLGLLDLPCAMCLACLCWIWCLWVSFQQVTPWGYPFKLGLTTSEFG